MTPATFNAVKAVLLTDSTILEEERARFLGLLRNGGAERLRPHQPHRGSCDALKPPAVRGWQMHLQLRSQ